MSWTYQEFEARLHARTAALHRRDTQLICWFGGLLGLGFLSTVLVTTISRRLALGGALAAVVGLAVLALYILASTRHYSRQHGIACPHCDVSLLEIGEHLDVLIEDGAPLPMIIRCPACGVAVISKA